MERVDYQSDLIQDIINLHSRDELILNPWYQRRAVWTRPQKAYLINTLLEHKPMPTIYIRHALDLDRDKSVREVVDGQQRLRAVLEFVAEEFTVRHPNHQERVSYSDLTRTEKENFRMTSISVGYLIGADDSNVIEIFGRLNSVSKTLNPQEKRNADYSGEFKQFCLKEAATRVSLWRDLRIFSANDLARMAEVQFVSDMALNLLEGLSDFSQSRLGALYKSRDEDFPEQFELTKRLDRVFEIISTVPHGVFTDTIFSRQPLFFSLFLVLDQITTRISLRRFQESLHGVDEMFHAEIPINERPAKDANFITACTSSTQRISSRRVRHDYLAAAIAS